MEGFEPAGRVLKITSFEGPMILREADPHIFYIQHGMIQMLAASI